MKRTTTVLSGLVAIMVIGGMGFFLLRAAFEQMRTALAPYQQTDFNDLATFFRLGGLRSALL